MRVNFDELHHPGKIRLVTSRSAQKAECICLRFLAEKSSIWCKFQCKYSIGASVDSLFLPDIGEPLDNVVGRLWKETLRESPQKAIRDALGADATLIENSTEGKYIRIRRSRFLNVPCSSVAAMLQLQRFTSKSDHKC